MIQTMYEPNGALPKVNSTNNNKKTPKNYNWLAGLIMFVIIIVAIGAVYNWVLSGADQVTQEMLDKGCIPMSSDYHGVPTAWKCPIG